MMDVGNLATVFGPNLFRLPVSGGGVTIDSKACIEKQLEETALVNQVTGYLITHVAYAFQVKKPTACIAPCFVYQLL